MGDLRVDAEVWPVRWPDGRLKGGAGLVGGANSCERDDWPQALMSKRAQPAGGHHRGNEGSRRGGYVDETPPSERAESETVASERVAGKTAASETSIDSK